MFNISIIDNDKQFGNTIANECKKILSDKNFVLMQYDSIDKFIHNDNYYKIGHILIVDEKFLTQDDILKLNSINVIYKNIHIMFYGDDLYSIPIAFEVIHFYFILKEQYATTLPLALKKGVSLLEKGYRPFFSIYANKKIEKIYFDEVVYFKFEHRKITFCTTQGCHELFVSKRNFINNMDKKVFLQVSTQEFINLNYVKKYNKYSFLMEDSNQINIPLTYIDKVKKILINNQNLNLKSSILQ